MLGDAPHSDGKGLPPMVAESEGGQIQPVYAWRRPTCKSPLIEDQD